MTNKQLSIILKMKDEASKQLKGIQGNLQRFANAWQKNWLAITAAITASILALQKAWNMMELGAKVEQQKQAFENLSASLGVSSEKIIEDLRKMSGETMSSAEIMEKASQAMILGIDPTKLAKMMEISRASARAFGKDVGFMFESIAVGVGRQSKLILDNLGIIVDAGSAYKKYAESIGKSVSELTEMEKKQAFLNAVLEAGDRILKQIDTSTMTNLEKMQKLKAEWQDFAVKIGQAMWHVLGFLQGFMNHLVAGMFTLLEHGTAAFNGFVQGVTAALNSLLKIGTDFLQKLMVPLIKFYELLGKLPGTMGETYRQAALEVKRFSASLENATIQFNVDGLSQSLDEARQAFNLAAKQSAQDAIKQYDLVFAKVKDTGDKNARIFKDVADEVSEGVKETAKQFTALEDVAKESASNMENIFGDFFFKAFNGELKDAKEAFRSFAESILREYSNIAAQMVMNRSGSGGIGGLFSNFVNSFAGGIGSWVSGFFHQGGVIRAHSGLSPDEVPIIAQAGEGIVSRRGMRAIGGSDNLRSINQGERAGGGDIIINQIIKAWDADDVYQNRKALAYAIADEIKNNQGLRGVIKQYG